MNKERVWNRIIIPLLENLVAPYSVVRRIYVQIILLGVAVLINAVVFITYQHLDWISAIYAGVNVVTTVGLYSPNIYQMPSNEKIILTLTIILAVGLYTSIVQSIIATLISRSTWNDVKARWRGKHMKGHTILIGNGSELLSAVRRLNRLSIDYIVLTTSKDIADKIKGDNVILGDPKDDNTLLSAGVKEAKNAIVMLEDDMEALLVTLKLQKLNPPLQVIVAIRDDSLRDLFNTAGADLVISREDIIGRIAASAAVSTNIAGLIFPERSGDMIIGIFHVTKKRRIKDLPDGVVPLAIIRGNRIDPFFTKETELNIGEQLVVLGNPSTFREVKELLE
ncbi:potassium channel family protein [Saccharolobus solfataricus]|uniref:Potassium channel protein, putative n=3 Tax=Saccharolobus solfataricus TaxID=2287 RepID=Q97XI3_SACS2|nr:NAD(P)-binding protein [Saccharolobus solfataricus]AAK41950.1 Potassium channel protein, putative [Saccharolobus solfataricus P2]SAI85444.1 potassium transporter TrkA [Saccharolobus solfataricus]